MYGEKKVDFTQGYRNPDGSFRLPPNLAKPKLGLFKCKSTENANADYQNSLCEDGEPILNYDSGDDDYDIVVLSVEQDDMNGIANILKIDDSIENKKNEKKEEIKDDKNDKITLPFRCEAGDSQTISKIFESIVNYVAVAGCIGFMASVYFIH